MNFEEIIWPRHVQLRNHVELTLRHARAEDAQRVLDYTTHVAGESENLAFGSNEFGVTLEQEQIVLQQYADEATSLYLLAEIGGEIAGTLTFTTEKRPRVRHAGEFGISVLQKYWGLGIGGQMLALFITWARQTGAIRKINLRVRVDNLSAIHLYEKHGFLLEGRRTREMYVREQFIDVLLMGLSIDPPV